MANKTKKKCTNGFLFWHSLLLRSVDFTPASPTGSCLFYLLVFAGWRLKNTPQAGCKILNYKFNGVQSGNTISA